MKYALAIWARRWVVTVERHGGTRGQQIKKYVQPWKKFRGKQVVGGDRKGGPFSSNQGKADNNIR